MKKYLPTGKYYLAIDVNKKNKTIYHVVCPDGRVANNYDHYDKTIAEKHLEMLIAFN